MLSKLHTGNSNLKDYSEFCCVGSSSNKQGTQIPNKKIRFDNIWCNDIFIGEGAEDPKKGKDQKKSLRATYVSVNDRQEEKKSPQTR